MREIDSLLAGIFWLILLYLVVVKGWNGANTLLGTTFKGGNATIKQLQGN